MESNLKVSILTPIYQVEKYIERCAKSLFEQTYENIEYIFVDDCSRDNSLKLLEFVLEEYPNRKHQARILRNNENKGVAAVRNILLSESSGEYLLWVDADDYIDKRTVEILIKRVVESNADIICFGAVKCTLKSEIPYMWKFEYDSKTFIFDILQRKTHNALWGRFMKRLLLIDNNITFFENLNIGEDLLVMLKAIYYAKKIESCDSLLYYYNKVNEKSITSSVSIKTYQMQIEVLNQIESFFRDKLEVRPLLQTKRMNIYLFCLYVSCLIGNKKMYENFRKEIKQIKGTCRPTNHFLYHIFLYCNNYFFNRIWAQIIKGVKNSLFAIQNS